MSRTKTRVITAATPADLDVSLAAFRQTELGSSERWIYSGGRGGGGLLQFGGQPKAEPTVERCKLYPNIHAVSVAFAEGVWCAVVTYSLE